MPRVLILISILGLLVGCASAPVDVSLKRHHASAARTARVFVVVPQERVTGQIIPTHGGGGYATGRGGLYFCVGHMVDLVRNVVAEGEMLDNIAPLQRATADLDFRRDVIAALKSSGVFVNPNSIELVTQAPQTYEQVDALIESAGDVPVVVISVFYRLSADYRYLIVKNSINVRLSARGRDVYSSENYYRSKAISLDNSAAPDAARMMPKWATDGARAFRAAYREGIDETIRIVRLALVDRPSSIGAGAGAGDGDRLVKFTDGRSIFLTPGGQFKSLAVGISYESVKSQLDLAPGMGRVYFYRPSAQFAAFIQPSLYANGTKIGNFCVGTYLYRDLRPGRYRLTLRFEGDATFESLWKSRLQNVPPVDLVVQESTSQFIRFELSQGLWGTEEKMQLVTKEVAVPEVGRLELYH
jgi:hypothetical protein